ncbi:MAG: hypothetical protein H7840_03130 [Alphaproteobacteria bacterium]
MIRIMVVLWTVLAAGVGVSLFLLKHEVQSLEDELNAVNRDIRAGHETIHVLKAEWSFLNDPARLRRLAETHLQMTSLRPEQITTVAVLPAALAAAAQGLPFAPASATVSGRGGAKPVVTAVAHQTTTTATPAAKAGAKPAAQKVAAPPPPATKPATGTRPVQVARAATRAVQ